MKILKTYKLFENYHNSEFNNINSYIKKYKNNIDFDKIRVFLDKMKSKRKFQTKTDHFALLVFTLRHITNTVILKELWELFLEYDSTVVRKDTQFINILGVIYRDYIINSDDFPEIYENMEDALNKYKNIILLLFDNGIDLLTKRTKKKINFFDILEEDGNTQLFLDKFSGNEYFMTSYKKNLINQKTKEFNL